MIRMRHHAPGKPFSADKAGSVAIMAAISIMALIYAAAIAFDLASLYLAKSQDQRIADQSAIAASFAYMQNNDNLASAQATAYSFAVSNGVGSGTVTTSIVSSPSGDGANAVMVVVATPVALSGFGRDATTTAKNPSGIRSITVSATAYAELHGGSPPCIIGLQSGGVTATGGVTAAATSCAISSGGNVSSTSGARVTAESVYAVGTIAASNGASLTTSPNAGQDFPGSSQPTDPFASSNVFAHLSSVAAMTAPMFPSVGSAPAAGNAIACTGAATYSAGIYPKITTSYYPTCSSMNFTGGSETDIGGIQIGGPSVTLTLASGVYKINGISDTAGSGTMTINMLGNVVLYIWGGINMTGSSSLSVNSLSGSTSYYIQGGITNSSSNTMTFTNSSSSYPSTFYVSGGISIANGSASFPDGTYVITSGDGTAGIDIAGGHTASFGNGSFNIANGISVGGGSTLTFGNAVSLNSLFQIPTAGSNGAISTGGGSTLTLGSFTNEDFNGAANIAGNLTLGSGVYTVNGAVNISASGGGSVSGSGVSIVSSGAISFGAGYSSVNLTAPSVINSFTNGAAATAALASNSSSAMVVTAGASNTNVLGALYAPNAPLQLSGAGNLNGGGSCLQVVAGSIALTGGSSLTTNCSSLGNSRNSGSVSLIQ